jgi:DNA-3-methyladenine glycosylase
MDRPVRAARPLLLTPAARLRQLLDGPVVEAARGLLGVHLVREAAGTLRVGRIVEVEAYGGPEDQASHARRGPASRAATMFGPAGRAYVYGVYGMHRCLNVVTGPAGDPAAVLVRAVAPLAGVDAMRASRVAWAVATRRADAADPSAAAARIARLPTDRLVAGPATLAAAFGIGLDDDRADLLDPASSLRLEPAGADDPPFAIVAGPRVGVAYAGPGWADRPWRFRARPATRESR